MRALKRETRAILIEAASALVIGVAAALVIDPRAMERIDDLVVMFLAVVGGAAIPGLALTVAAPRPAAANVPDAKELGNRLLDQVHFWFGYLLWSGLSVFSVMVGSAFEWRLSTPRPTFIPGWVPTDGGAWLVLVSVSMIAFAAIRLRRVVDAVLDLVELGTQTHIEQTLDARRKLQEAVAEEIQNMPARDRGAPVEARERVPRRPAS